ncbi:DUF7344 domain-containing protein [Halorussus ruber]|uniref:DUF7344 domain-containing protein n=1 Tax=Halorussus ruber TaxID=1126238 RepID=UPI001092C834|nr:hypothetical protein [Halorussus ruber]
MNLKSNEARPGDRRSYDGQSREEWDDDQTYELLANRRRRECVRYLARRTSDESETVSVRDLADGVADAIAGGESAPENLRQSVYTSLSQHHLDKLDECGVIEYHPDSRSVSTGPNFETIRRVSTDATAERRVGAIPPWTSALTLAALLLTATAYPQLPTLPVLGVAALNLIPVGLFVQTRFAGE